MPKSLRYLTFDGQYESGVLGAFRIIRGFANLKELAEISVAYQMQEGSESRVVGQQRTIDERHAQRVKLYLEGGEQRFLPEVILSVRVKLEEELDQHARPLGVRTASNAEGVLIQRAYKSSQHSSSPSVG